MRTAGHHIRVKCPAINRFGFPIAERALGAKQVFKQVFSMAKKDPRRERLGRGSS
jgi:hypothetical protein